MFRILGNGLVQGDDELDDVGVAHLGHTELDGCLGKLFGGFHPILVDVYVDSIVKSGSDARGYTVVHNAVHIGIVNRLGQILDILDPVLGLICVNLDRLGSGGCGILRFGKSFEVKI